MVSFRQARARHSSIVSRGTGLEVGLSVMKHEVRGMVFGGTGRERSIRESGLMLRDSGIRLGGVNPWVDGAKTTRFAIYAIETLFDAAS